MQKIVVNCPECCKSVEVFYSTVDYGVDAENAQSDLHVLKSILQLLNADPPVSIELLQMELAPFIGVPPRPDGFAGIIREIEE